ncbi:putative toxin-antitoxin system toxin component, PIN family [Hydrogenophaga sp. PBL-H3]|uniref:putative toxin-antitoxin system toxin component, PIN family n=1 Tax=Hydrogenophaga sp. PBL-H3 TaxID=434010 RepID=UPI00132043EE|nr:putative toxin-antitoxin system toxin component, PIN family [Hydrogenophaga sp. PBL-H3]QHE74948.1 putative toxin-antitoxin system toxin component, PIN family [Hydrogenophaga sp. PBL-H3]QHE79375.1 putative toxin-antitoxin system toxin component, PIN family [Hydrogenophaga sp. PBL-H3]
MAEVPDTTDVLVLDTNIVLDIFVFQDPVTAPLRQAVERMPRDWLVTAAMREELVRVLDYPQIARRLQAQARPAQDVLDAFDRCTRLVPESPKAAYTCKDADDQKFVDLAAEHRATLVSKDDAVLCMAKRLARVGVHVCREWNLSHVD